MPRAKPSAPPSAPAASPTPPAGVDRKDQVACPIHRCPLDDTGYCVVAAAWWYPKFACPTCGYWLWDNGYCVSCTAKLGQFPGDYFEARWDEGAGREWGHYVRVHRGPTPVQTLEQVTAHLTELRALVRTVGREIGQAPLREMGDEPSWITEEVR